MFCTFVFVLLYNSAASSILHDGISRESSISMDAKLDTVIQKLLTRLDFLEDRLLAQETELNDLKEKHAVDLRDMQNDYEKKINAITEKLENVIGTVYRRYDVATKNKAEGEHNLPGNSTGNDDKRDTVEEFIDDDTPSADEPKLVDSIGGNTRNVRTKENLESCQQKQRSRRFDSEYNVSFFAKIVQNVHHLGQGQNVIFDTVVTNNGNAYNPYLGAFVAPVGGTYMFSTSLVTFNNDTSHYGIFVNNDRMTILYVNGVDNNSDSTSQTVVLQLQEQDTVTVRHLDTDKSLVGYHHSLFSGALIAQDDLSGSGIIGK